MHTESEARNAWCPFVRNADGSSRPSVAYNRVTDDDGTNRLSENSMCIGSQCMAWRWRTKSAPTHGYCGLAGKP